MIHNQFWDIDFPRDVGDGVKVIFSFSITIGGLLILGLLEQVAWDYWRLGVKKFQRNLRLKEGSLLILPRFI